MTVNEWLRSRLLSCVRAEVEHMEGDPVDILDVNFDLPFLSLMAHRMIMGYLRYGPMRNKKTPPTENIKEIRRRIDLYEKTGNQEHLADIANIAMVEYVKPCHPAPCFESTDDGIHAERRKG